ncbi:MCM family [Trichomonas vaginalis G3]|uniref:MCM family n=1 Tax=Trichomonas vaginalis (strain ATCC PRA-98 / G3) TaxID=412133 RepID=UPI0021E55AF4|nr:MCM family [Trichomonas vaginalis G3]KAI5546817.1 MCM family [Trichomonas vaginalis G3]
MEDSQATNVWEVPAATVAMYRNMFSQFFDSDFSGHEEKYYREAVDNAVNENKKRILINLDHLREFDRLNGHNITQELIKNPKLFQQAINEALNEYRKEVNAKGEQDLTFGITGPIGDHFVSPRQLNTRFLNHIVCLDGIVTKTSLVNPKLVTLVQFCPATNQRLRTQFHDATDLTARPSRFAIPNKDANDNPLEVEYGFSTFIDHQIITIQERPESAPAGQMPRNCDVIADADLADACKPGDRVKVYGVYRILPNKVQGTASGIYHPLLIANSIEVAAQTLQLNLTKSDVENIRFIAGYKENNQLDVEENTHVLDLLSRSIAPSIYGSSRIKEAIVLMLAGGCETNLPDGTHIRGDINMLMVGDPSTAKSQLLRHVLNIAPLAVHTTGRGASGVGLTASVTTDTETGERRLEAGAMVIADRGVVCIDEFDKMDEADRVAIHEALEQQTVTISKAGIHATLNARCSVAAAANPVWGTYNPNRSPMDNVGLPDSLISRFDLLFIVLDQHNPQVDAAIADHVLENHKWKSNGPSTTYSDDGIYLKSDAIPHVSQGEQQNYVTVEFLKKYITHCKDIKPTLTKEANELLVSAWADMRAVMTRKTQPITPRTFETLIRLSTAAAKIRLSSTITEQDANTAISLLKFSVYGEDEEPPKPRTKKLISNDDKKKKSKKTKKTKKDDDNDDSSEPEAVETDEELENSSEEQSAASESDAEEKEGEQVKEDELPKLVESYVGDELDEKRKAFQEVYKYYINQTDKVFVTLDQFIETVELQKGVVITRDELKILLSENKNVTFDDENIAF